MLLVSHTDTVEAQPTFYAQLTTLARQLEQEATNEGKKRPQAAERQPRNEHGPVPWGRGSQSKQMAGRSGQFANHQAKLDALVKLLMEPRRWAGTTASSGRDQTNVRYSLSSALGNTNLRKYRIDPRQDGFPNAECWDLDLDAGSWWYSAAGQSGCL
jgi:hypothetical protein